MGRHTVIYTVSHVLLFCPGPEGGGWQQVAALEAEEPNTELLHSPSVCRGRKDLNNQPAFFCHLTSKGIVSYLLFTDTSPADRAGRGSRSCLLPPTQNTALRNGSATDTAVPAFYTPNKRALSTL